MRPERGSTGRSHPEPNDATQGAQPPSPDATGRTCRSATAAASPATQLNPAGGPLPRLPAAQASLFRKYTLR